MKKDEFASMIDHSALKNDLGYSLIKLSCMEAIKYKFATVAVNNCNISIAAKILKGSGVGIDATISFPFGTNSPEIKAFEVKDAIKKGATEIDFVINIGALKDRNYDILKKEMELIKKVSNGRVVKSILEVGFLADEEIIEACHIAVNSEIDFVKTATGFYKPTLLSNVKLIFKCVKNTNTKIKVAGGIKNLRDALEMIEAGAKRFGTSRSVEIMEEWKGDEI